MLPIGFCLTPFGVTYAQAREAARVIDDAGYDSLWTWDHYVSWNDPREPVLEGLTTLAGLAEATNRIRLGTLVANNTNRHPARLAKIAATLHELSGGRFELGIGAGGYAAEQQPFGIVEPPDAERVARVSEALQIIKPMWTGQPVTFAGTYYTLRDAYCSPTIDPPPRLLVGASGPRMAGIAGRYADGLNLQWRNRKRFDSVFPALDQGLASSGRTRANFDLSLLAGWRDLGTEPLRTLEDWAAQGFTRIIIFISAPFPLREIEVLAQQK